MSLVIFLKNKELFSSALKLLTVKTTTHVCPKPFLVSIALSIIFLSSLHAQEGFSTTGGQAQGTAGSSSYTLGQVLYTTHTGSTGSVAQGVQQTYDIVALLGAAIAGINLELGAYPNPTQETLTLKIDNYKNESLTYQLYDLQGKLWDSQSVKGAQTQLDMKDLAVGTYLLSIQDQKALIKTFRIIKN